MNEQQLKRAWQEAPGGNDGQATDAASINALNRRVRMRNLREYAAALLAGAVFAAYAFVLDELLLKLGSIALIGGLVAVAWNLHRRASARRPDSAELASPCLAYLKADLTRQRDALRSVWKWYLLPLAPGMVLFLAGLAVAVPAGVAVASGLGLALALLAWCVIRLDAAAADRLDRELRALDDPVVM